jgi:lipoprotein NlpD
VAGDNVKTQPKAVRAPYSDQTYAQMSGAKPEPSTAKPDEGDDSVNWSWPATGKVISTFNDSANLKGIGIAGKLGQPVLASAPGRVIFSGTGIRGFGKLIVIKHNNTFLSVYAHNNELLVKEGQNVAKGQRIAEMGSTDTDQVKLHFEIRRFGKPVDPAKLLPPT